MNRTTALVAAVGGIAFLAILWVMHDKMLEEHDRQHHTHDWRIIMVNDPPQAPPRNMWFYEETYMHCAECGADTITYETTKN